MCLLSTRETLCWSNQKKRLLKRFCKALKDYTCYAIFFFFLDKTIKHWEAKEPGQRSLNQKNENLEKWSGTKEPLLKISSKPFCPGSFGPGSFGQFFRPLGPRLLCISLLWLGSFNPQPHKTVWYISQPW